MPDTIYDVAIIGSGPGGYTAAFRAGQLGLKTCLIEKDEMLGGTCLHVGCIPTKALLFNAEVYDHLKAAQEYGIDGLGTPKVNWKVVQDRKNKIVAKHTKGLDFLVRKNKVDRVLGFGRLTGRLGTIRNHPDQDQKHYFGDRLFCTPASRLTG